MSQTESTVPAFDAATELGKTLRRQREYKKLSIGEVSERLKLPARQIEALENGNYDSLPEPIFIRGFLRSYGRFLDVDEEVLTEALEHISPMPKVKNTISSGSLKLGQDEHKKTFPKWILALCAIAAMGYGIYVWQTKSQNEHDKQEATSTPTLVASEASIATSLHASNVIVKPMTASDAQTIMSSAPAQASAPVTIQSGELVINTRYRTMMTVTNAQGEVLINQIVPARTEHHFASGAPFEVRLGYAIGSTATFNGRTIDIDAARKGGKTAVFTAEDSVSATSSAQ